jgi:hypothetical protein
MLRWPSVRDKYEIDIYGSHADYHLRHLCIVRPAMTCGAVLNRNNGSDIVVSRPVLTTSELSGDCQSTVAALAFDDAKRWAASELDMILVNSPSRFHVRSIRDCAYEADRQNFEAN